jgi:predicted carbohydrate-binding protein with CBM5 and CBM33 domain
MESAIVTATMYLQKPDRELHVWSKSLALRMEKLPPQYAREARHHIENVMFDVENKAAYQYQG